MSTTSVRFNLICTADDPQVPARVMGIFAARSLLPDRYLSERTRGAVRIEVAMQLESDSGVDPAHLARVLNRIATVERVALQIDDEPASFLWDPVDVSNA